MPLSACVSPLGLRGALPLGIAAARAGDQARFDDLWADP